MNVATSPSVAAEQLTVKEESSVMKDVEMKMVSVPSWFHPPSFCSCVVVSTMSDQKDLPVSPVVDPAVVDPAVVVPSVVVPANTNFYNLKKPFLRLVMKKPPTLPTSV